VAGDMVKLGRVGKVAAFVPFVGGSALLQSAVKVAKAAPVVALLTGAVGVLLARRVPTENWRRVGGAAGRGVELTARLIAVHQAFQEHVQAAAPELPQWNELASHPAEPVLTRALMWTLAHAPRSQMTVAELVTALPPLTIGQGERPTRHALRGHRPDVFQEFPRGTWQLGRSPLPIGKVSSRVDARACVQMPFWTTPRQQAVSLGATTRATDELTAIREGNTSAEVAGRRP
jgi:hypothetical protein